MIGSPRTVVFHCERLHVKLLPTACGQRWRGANAEDGPRELTTSACNGCPIGKRNAELPAPSGPAREQTALVRGAPVRILPRGERTVADTFRELPSSDPAWAERVVPLLAFLCTPRSHGDLVEWARVTKHGTQHLTDLLAWSTTEGRIEGSARTGWRLAGTTEEPMAGPSKDAEPRTCAKCTKPYTPTGNRQKYCSDCGPASRAKPSKPDTRLALIKERATAVRQAAPAVTVRRVKLDVDHLVEMRDARRADADALDRVLALLEAGTP